MKLAQALVLLLSQLDSSSAWLATPVTRAKLTTKLSAHSPADFLNDENNNLDAILSEGPMTSQNQVSQQSTYKVALPVVKSGDNDQSTIILASAATATIAEESSTTAATTVDGEASTTADSEADPYASAFDSQMEKMQMYTERVEEASKSNSVGDRLKNMDLQDIISTLIVPSIAVFAAGRWAFNRVSSRVSENTDAVLDSFAREMIYHDGDFDEMKLCFQDYSRKLVVLGLSKTDTMLKTYLEAYAKKKTVSPQAIVSLSYALTLAKLSEAKAAELFVSLCRKMGPEKIASSGKLLFLGNRILKSPEGRQALEPIKDMIKATYRDEEVAETLVETSQKAMAEAAYRAAVQAGGKSQTSLTPGWETLGLDKETAQRVFDDEAEEGFVTDRETMYGGQTTKYDSKGRILDKDGKIADPEEAAAAEKEVEEEEAVSNVYECSECGYTLFVAQGRESKFYGSDFKCPECGAPKEKFEARDDFGED